MPRGRMGCVGRSPVQGLVFLQSAREQICRLDGESSCLLPSLEALGWVHTLAVQHWCSGKGTVGSAGPAPVPQDEARLLLTLKCSGSWEGKLVTGEQSGLAGVCSDRISVASFLISEHKCVACI